jgi:spore germination protein GerM
MPIRRIDSHRIISSNYRRSRPMSIAALTCLTLTACSIPQEGNVQSIDPVNIPYELNATTTSTTIVPEIPSTTSDVSTEDGAEPSVETVNLFFIAGTQVVPISRLLLSPASANQVLASLIEGLPPGDVAAGLRTAIPDDSNLEISVERGIARVDLPPVLTSAIPGSEQRLAIAQIVLTLTRRAGIGQVVFTSGGRPQSVPRGRGDLTQPGGAVACEDYSNLLPAGFAC